MSEHRLADWAKPDTIFLVYECFLIDEEVVEIFRTREAAQDYIDGNTTYRLGKFKIVEREIY